MSFIQDSADSLSTSHPKLVAPWITPEIRRKIRRRNETHAKAKKNEVRNSDQNMNLWEEKLILMLGSSLTCM